MNTLISRSSACHRPTSASINPSKNPPSMQPRGLFNPPTIAAEKALSAIVRPMKTEAVVMGTTNMPARPANPELTTKANTTIADTLMPISVAAVRLCATARTALPIFVLLKTRSRQTMTKILETSTRIS